MPILLAALSALLYGGADFAGGWASRRGSILSVLIVSQIAGTIVALLAAPLLGPNSPDCADLLWGAVGGLCGAVGLGFLYYGIGRGIVAVVSPLSALTGALIPMIYGLITGEMPSPLAWAGTAFCVPATVLLSVAGPPVGTGGVRLSFLYGVLAGIGFGGFFIAVSRSSEGAGLWPLLAARCLSIMTVGALAFFLRRPVRIAPGNWGLVLFTGLLDMSANIAFLLAARAEMLILVTVVTSLFPAPTVLLARVLMGQKLGPARAAGLCMAIAGVALIGLR